MGLGLRLGLTDKRTSQGEDMPLKLESSIWDWDWEWEWEWEWDLRLGMGMGIGILSEAVGQKNLTRRGHIAQIGKFKGLGLIFGRGSYQRSCLAKER